MRQDYEAGSMNGYQGYREGDQEREYREMVEIDVQQHHPQQHQQQQQPQYFQDQHFQQHQQQPAPAYQHYEQPYEQQPYDDPQARSGDQQYPQQYPQQSQSQQRPMRPTPAHVEDYSYVSPEWPLSAGGSPNPQYFADTPGGSRSGTPSLRSGRATPLDAPHRHPHSSVDWRPSSLMNQSHLSLAALLPGSTPGSSPPNASKDFGEHHSIQQVHNRDDVEIWKGWKRHLYTMVPFLTIMNTLLYLGYLALRIMCVIWAQNAQNAVYATAWIFIGVEVATAIPSLMHNTWTMWSMKKRQRPKLRLTGNDCPTVDVFITCCGEEDDLVMDTVRAAADLDYPTDRFRVVILDDGKSAGLESALQSLSHQYPNIHYIARLKVPGVPHHFKAGNLNNGLDQMHLLPGGAGQFMAALDADMIPERDWLRAVLPHLLVDPKMALACPPQLFYNTPPSDPLAQSLDFFVHVIEPIKDALGVAWCTGSGYVVRREALDQIGNFPLGSLAEDVATSTLMLGKGWKTAYVHEPLQFGTVPEDYGGHLKQRTRWAIGTVDTSFKLKFCLYGDKVKEMTFAQRFSGFLYASLSMYTILLTISLFAIPIILVMGKPLVAYANNEQLRWLIWGCFASVISNRLCEFVLFIPAGYHTGQRGSRYQLWMSPYIALCIIRSFILPTWLGGQTQAFKPTGSLGSALNERDAKLRKGMFRRLWGILFNFMAFFHLAFVYLTLVGLVMTTYRCFYRERNSDLYDTLISLLTHAFWPPLTFVFLCSSLWTPISYAIDPPTMPDREELLDRDPKTRVAHPTRSSKKIAFGGQAAWFEFELTPSTDPGTEGDPIFGDDPPTRPSSRVSAARKASLRASKASLRLSQRKSRASSIASSRYTALFSPDHLDGVPPVPPIPNGASTNPSIAGSPLAALTDFSARLRQSMGASSVVSYTMSPSPEQTALAAAQAELLELLGLQLSDITSRSSSGGAAPRRTRPRSASDAQPPTAGLSPMFTADGLGTGAGSSPVSPRWTVSAASPTGSEFYGRRLRRSMSDFNSTKGAGPRPDSMLLSMSREGGSNAASGLFEDAEGIFALMTRVSHSTEPSPLPGLVFPTAKPTYF